MSGEAAGATALEATLEELAHAFAVTAACIPSPIRREHPALEAAAARLGLQLSLTPAGDEQLILVSAAAEDAEALDTLASALKSFERAPYVVFVSPLDHPERAHAAARTVIATSSEWLQNAHGTSGHVLLAPVERLLARPSVPGEWLAAPADRPLPDSEDEALSALWQTVDADRAALDAVARNLERETRELDDLRRSRERLAAELARVRDGERQELDRMRVAMLDERAWVAEQARRIAASTSWRLGHRLVRLSRALTLRRDHGTDLPARVAARMEREELP